MKRSFIFAILLAIAATAWILSGQLGESEAQPEAQKPPADLSALDKAPQVRVRASTAQRHAVIDLLRGRTEANRLVEIKSETNGRIIKLPVEQGSYVAAGDVIARLSSGDRNARLAEAKALRAQREIEYQADKKLAKKGFRAETQMAATKASLEAAEAAVKIAEVELAYTVIRAPFDGVVDDRMMEIGDFADIGDSLARLVELDPMLIVAQVNEREVQRLAVGNPGQARLMTGAVVDGTIRHISAVADPATRTFRVELEVPNPNGAISDGMTAEIALPLDDGEAHLVSPAILTLADEGIIGVKSVDENNRVVFHPVQIVDTDKQGIWVVGPPTEVMLITVGQEYVNAGDEVRPVDEQEIDARMRELGS
ncbi:efflux RND transporter periplasmic adaptor subunit [Pelagibius litoralis]|uniref:Efflux RND transporter periplasmic adaptor subunit n=1 Tax=Pelagibius litoralis TaxID=374515 RepID=A0A967F0N0_9PROT|nr:efflux RND transporter periplasmic adaptor subunit [Pelagibius litoralis]NIA70899.1 efflux RND transporter periplasmic adaptor subunit [Pelagibius litoralis]